MTTVFQPDLRDPDLYLQSAPHEVFARLRREQPVYWNPEADGPGFWSLTRYADIVEVSRRPDLFSSAHENGGHRIFNENEVGLTGANEAAIGVPFISRDPPSHGEYRKFIMPALTPKRLEGIEQRVSARCAALLDQVPLDETIDIVPLLAAPLPLLVAGLAQQSPAWIGAQMDGWLAYPGTPDDHARRAAQWRAVAGEDKPYVSFIHLDLDDDPSVPLQRFRFGARTGRDGLIAELKAMRDAGVQHIGLQLRQNRRPLAETLQEIADHVLPVFHGAA